MVYHWLSFKKARKIIRKLKLSSCYDYYSLKKPNSIPRNPYHVYKNKGWISWPDWLGKDINHPKRRHKVNDDFFKIWTNNMSYILGFWFSDGHIYKDKNRRLIFSISQDEKNIIENILLIMGSDNKIIEQKRYNGKISYKFFIESKEIVSDIIKLGGDYRKSLTCKFPYIPKEFLPDFVRGLWDGDGSVYILKNDHNKKMAEYSCGSKQFIEKLLEILLAEIPNFSAVLKRDKRRKSSYKLKLSANNARRLRNYMYYNNCLCLQRKKEIFFSFGDFCMVKIRQDNKVV